MIKDIFSAIETRLKAHSTFSGFNFFRFESDKNSNQQSKGSVPFLRLFWQHDETRKAPKRWLLDNNVLFGLEIRWVTAYEDVNDINRITEQQTHRQAAIEAIFPGSGEENFLDLTYIADLRLKASPLEIGGLERLKHNGIFLEITVEYIQGVS